MVQFYAEILRGVGFRDNNFKLVASNDPGIGATDLSSFGFFTGTANTNGDILSLMGTTGSAGVLENFPSLSTTTWPYVVTRAKGAGTIKLDVTEGGSGGPFTETFTLTLS